MNETVWQWLKTAPLPVVLAITLSMAVWVYAIQVEQTAEKVKSEGVKEQVGRMDGKVDRLLDMVYELKWGHPPPVTAPTPSPEEKK